MKKVSTLFNYLYLSTMMVLVIVLLLVSIARDSVSSLFEKKKSTQHVKNKVPSTKQKSSKYIIHT